MRIPPYYEKRQWQIFFFGAVIGGIVGWLVLLFIYGELQERQAATIQMQKELIQSLEEEKNIWQEEFQKLNEKNNEQLTVQAIDVKIINADKYKIDSLSKYEAEEAIKEDIRIVLAKDLEFVYNSRELIKKTIENKPIKINDKRYKFVVKEMLVYTNLLIHLEIQLAD
mgnify:FL=1